MIKTETNHLWNLENENNKMCISNKINIQSDVFQQLMYFYTLAIKEIETKIEAINKKYSQYHLVDHLKTRIKEPKSILEKMRKKSYELTYENLIGKVNDIAGIRIICPLKNNLYIIKSLLEQETDIRVIKIKDYVAHPKKSGYSSLHMIVEVPIKVEENTVLVKTEIQIRTVAMDFWAELEHDIKYKPQTKISMHQSKELIKCAKMLNRVEDKMIKIYNS